MHGNSHIEWDAAQGVDAVSVELQNVRLVRLADVIL
jgi:hypothetical protein